MVDNFASTPSPDPIRVTKFATMEEVHDYLGGERIQCLLCGHYYRRLQFLHLASHGTDADGYRETFGIPWKYSLTSAPSRNASRIRMTPERIAEFMKHPRKDGWNRQPRRGRCPAVAEKWSRDAELGREASARRRVTVPCSGGCGSMLETTALTAVQPIHCDKCASPWALKQRRFNASRKKAA
jgi:hypothetical protein